jgi:hypothetical protein
MDMNAVRNGARATACFLNQPVVKEGVKNVAGSLTLAFGLVEIYDLYRDRNTLAKDLTVEKVIRVSARVSLILSAGVSRPGVYLISSLVGCVFSTEQLTRVFGPNTIFAINPWHPRHVVSIVAVILALPAVVQMVTKGFSGMKLQLMTGFNTMTSRPVLHIGNQLCHSLIR